MNKFEVTIFERAEHWEFTVVFEAKDREDVYKQFYRDYGKKDYRIVRIYG